MIPSIGVEFRHYICVSIYFNAFLCKHICKCVCDYLAHMYIHMYICMHLSSLPVAPCVAYQLYDSRQSGYDAHISHWPYQSYIERAQLTRTHRTKYCICLLNWCNDKVVHGHILLKNTVLCFILLDMEARNILFCLFTHTLLLKGGFL